MINIYQTVCYKRFGYINKTFRAEDCITICRDDVIEYVIVAVLLDYETPGLRYFESEEEFLKEYSWEEIK